ncbi:MAG TPA: hypothetical protein VLC98_11700 [Phnomibacter sp.]|nr:hypothetical protein [Phnomibacter sp.]
MKNLSFLYIGLLAFSSLASAQDSSILYKKGQLSKGKVEYYGNKYDCSILEFDAPPDVVENAIKQMMSKRGYNASTKKGFLVYRNVVLRRTELKDPVDVFTEIEAKSRSEKNKSTVSMIITVPGAIPDKKIEKSQADAIGTIGLVGLGSALIGSLEEDVSLSAHNNEMTTLQEQIDKTQKELNSLVTDSLEYQKKLQKLQQSIVDNGKAQADAKQKLQETTKRLEMLKSRKLELKN